MTRLEEIAWIEPELACAAFAQDPRLCWLDGAAAGDPRSAWSYLCVDPYCVLEARGDEVRRDGDRLDCDPLEALRRELARGRESGRRCETNAGAPPFRGGAVGYLGYELRAEGLPKTGRAPPGEDEPPDLHFAFYDRVLCFDLRQRRAFVAAPESRRADLRDRLDAMRARRRVSTETAAAAPLRWRRELSRDDYEARVARTLEYIVAGDIYQANFTVRHVAPRENRSALELYLALRRAAPAPFSSFLRCGPDVALASASPERFLRLDASGLVETRPIKGSRPRRMDAASDAREASDLIASHKDRAENLMIVDLMRNDLGRVAAPGTVQTPRLFEIESFTAMHHLVSEVRARLRENRDAVDLLRASFPPGSVTGAPKIRAMQIIEELEPARRGPYCGALAWIGFDGAMDSSVIIRTLVVAAERLVAQAGGGVVAESDPRAEFDEQEAKARPLLTLFDSAAGEER